MWVDNDVLNSFPTLKNFYRSPFSKWPPQYHTVDFLRYCGGHFENSNQLKLFNVGNQFRTSLSTHIKLWWYRTMLNFCDIVVTILKMAHHNTAKIQHCPISSQFDMWVDNDVLNWFPTLNNFYWLLFSKWPPQYRKKSILSDIITIWNSGHHYLPTYQIVMISDNVDFFRYCGGHFENGDR
jgi:hypothetical protein